MAKRCVQPASSSNKRIRVAATDNVVPTPKTTSESASQPTSKPASQRRSPRKALAAASQAIVLLSPEPTFESQFLESQLEEEIVVPTEGSHASIVATTKVRDRDD